MRLYQLEYFIKVVECGSITKAAQELYLSQPSLTKAISSLESEYQMKLMVRTAKGIRLTKDGKTFLEYARSAVESCNSLEQTFGSRESATVPKLVIASQQFDFIYDILLELCQKNSHQRFFLDMRETDRGEIVRMVADSRADVGLAVFSEKDSRVFKSEFQAKNLELHILDTSSVYVSMGKHSELYDREWIDISDAAKYPHIMLDTEQTMRREMLYKSEYDGVGQEPLIFCNTVAFSRKFLRETNALMFTPKWVLGLLQEEELRCVPLWMDGEAYPPVNHLVLIKRAGEEFLPLEQQFMELLKKHFRSS